MQAKQLPGHYYAQNAQLAFAVSDILKRQAGDSPEVTIEEIAKMAQQQELDYLVEPTFAKALLGLIERSETTDETKLELIREMVRMTVAVHAIVAGKKTECI